MDRLFQIGAVARMFHLSVGSLRHYEALGLLRPERIDRRLQQLHDARTADLGTIRLVDAPACALVWMPARVRPRTHLDLEWSIRRLEEDRPGVAVFLGKVGVGIDRAALEAGRFDEYDRVFLLLEEGDACDGAAEVVPTGPCVTVRFRGSHQEAPEQYRRIMAWLRARGLRPARPSREITLIDDGLTRDPAQFVTEIAIPVERDEREEGDA